MARQNFQVRAHFLRFSLVCYGLGVWFGLPKLNKLELGDVARQNFQVKAHCLRFFSALIFGWLALEDDLGRTSRLGHII